MDINSRSSSFDNRVKEMQAEGSKRPKHEIRAMEPAFEAMTSAVALAKCIADNPSDAAIATIFAALFADARLNERLMQEQALLR